MEMKNLNKYLLFFVKILFAIFVIAVIYKQFLLLDYVEWGDESETIVVTKMLASGSMLYAEIFNHHGPLVFAPGFILEKFGSFGIGSHRVFIAILTDIALLSIFRSSLNSSNVGRLFVASVSAFTVFMFMPEFFSHTYQYQVLCAFISVIILVEYVIPIIKNNSSVNFNAVALSNFLIFCLPFLAVTYVPWAFLLFVSSFKRINLKPVALGCIASIAINILFMLAISSFEGYYQFHILMNSEILPLFQNEITINYFLSVIYTSLTIDKFNFFWALMLFISLAGLATFEKSFPWRSLLLGAGFLSLLIRGAGFHNLPFYISLLPMLVIFKPSFYKSTHFNYFMVLWLLFASSKLLMFNDDERKLFKEKAIPKNTPFSELVKSLTAENEKILAYSFQNFEYIASNRLPASGHFFYLPWQDLYLKNPNPKFAYNPCDDLAAINPKLLLIDKFDKWSSKRVSNWGGGAYGECIQKYVDANYFQFPGIAHTYVRNDLKSIGIVSDFPPTKLENTNILSSTTPIFLNLDVGKLGRQNKLGLLFGTYSKVNLGNASLEIEYADSTKNRIYFELSDLPDFKYVFFDVQPKIIKSARIVASNGGGVTLWGARDSRGVYLNCVVYKNNSTYSYYTPGCPIK
jgi:hypothetical protein